MADATTATSKPGKRYFVIWSLIGAVAGLAIASFAWWVIGGKVWTDGRELRVPASRARPREVLWTPPKALDASFNTPDQEYEPSVSPDGTELYFVRGKAARNADILVSYRRNNQWTPPEPLAGVNSEYDDLGPRLTADGQFLLFYSDRPGGIGQYDIWAAPRLADGGGWGEPFNLGPNVNSEFNEFNPAPTPDGKRLIFATNRKAASSEQKEAWRATIRQSALGDYDLFIADVLTPSPLAGELAFKPGVEIPGVNTPYHEGASCVSPVGDFLYFASNRPGGYGKFDLYRSRILPDAPDGAARFGPPENVGPSVNTPDNEADPQLALGGFHLLFSSDRPRPTTGGYDLFAADSREVYAEREGRPLPTLGWSWWVLIGSLLLLIPLLRYFRGWSDHRLNVLQKCLLVSVLLHVLLTIALSFIAVTHEVIQFAKQEMGIGEVAVGADGARDVEIGLAIRSGSGGPGLPVAAETPPSIEQRAAMAASDAMERPQDLDAGLGRASSASDASMVVQALTPRSVPANTSDRVTVAATAEQAAAPEVTLTLQPPVSEAERAVRPAAAEVNAQRVAVPNAAAASTPQPVRLAAGPASADGARATSVPSAAAPTSRSGSFTPAPFRPGKAVIYADVMPSVEAPRAGGGRVKPAEDVADLAAAQQPGGPGAGGGLTRTEVAVGASCPAGVEVGAPAATAARQSLLQESSAPGIGSASAAGRPGAAANALSPGATSVAIKPDAPSELGDVVIGPTPRGGAAKATAEAAPALAAVDEPVAVARAATAASGPPGAAGGAALNLPPLAGASGPTQPDGARTGNIPGLPRARPTAVPLNEGGVKGTPGGVGGQTLVAVAPSVAAPSGSAGRAAVAAEKPAAASGGPETGLVAQKQDTSAPSRDGGPAGAPAAAARIGAGPTPAHAAGRDSIASGAAVGPRTLVTQGASPAAPGAAGGAGGPVAVDGPAVTLSLAPGKAGGAKAGPGGVKDSMPSVAEAIVASERIKPGDATAAPSDLPAVGLAAAPVGPAKFTTAGASGDSGGGGVRPRTGEVTAAPLNLEVAITAPSLGAPAPLAQRAPEARKPLLEKWGGTRESEDAVERALDYLARNQEPDGRWTFVDRGSKPGQRGENPHDMALTGLATLAFLAADHTPVNDGPYRDTVANAIKFLLDNQRPTGDLRGRQTGGGADMGNMYDQGIATLALSEAALMTGDKRQTDAAMKAAQFIVKAQNRESGGWRYLPGEYGDTSVFGWQVMALHSARQLGFELPDKTKQNALRYIAMASTGREHALAGYQPGHGPTMAMTAELLFSRMLLADELTGEAQEEASQFLTQHLPDSRRADFYGWYYGSLSLLQLQNDAWKKWNERTRETLIRMQKRGGKDDGCWESNVQWGDRGGRIFSTALGALTLEVYYRYLPIAAERQGDDAPPVPRPKPPDIGYLAR